MRTAFRWADRVLRMIERAGLAVAALAFALMMGITVADVAGRYLFRAPLSWSFDLLTSYLMVAGFFFAISSAQAAGKHVGVDIVARRLPPRLRSALLGPALLAGAATTGVIALAGWHGFERAWTQDLVLDGIVAWPRWPTFVMVAAGAALLTARLVLEGLASLAGALGHDPGIAARGAADAGEPA